MQAHESARPFKDRARGSREISTHPIVSARRLRRTRGAVFLVLTLFYGVVTASSASTPSSSAFSQTDSRATQSSQPSPAPLELSRTVRPWEFLSAVGTEAGIFGNESGNVEAWVYPLKILRDFHLRFHTDNRIIDSASLARTITARPESVTILYTGDTYNVRETFFVPVAEQGAIIRLEIETEHPLEIEALFQRDLQLEWPAGLGGTYGYWDEPRKAFYFGEETKKFVALVGSPTAHEPQVEYATNYSSSDQNGFRLGATQKDKDTKLIVIAASVNGPAEADHTYQHLLADSAALLQSSANYYRDYLARTISLDLPDKQLQRAYDWSRISELQGVVKNPYLGTGIVAGYRASGSSQRPGFAWFFGRDSMWTSLAYDASGDFASTRTALDFLSKVQRADGKIPHEIAQAASLVPWFTDYPYAFASADATPLYIITMNDYVTESGDIAFAKEKWPSLEKACAFLRSTYDAQGLPQNFGIGHGWVEGGPLLPVRTELYQSALGLEAVRALANLARLTRDESRSKDLAATFEKQKSFLNDAFWLPETKRLAFALDTTGKKIDEPSVLATVPMWFGLLDPEKANSMIDELAKPTHQTDWGMRIIASDSAKYSAGGYHFGAVWPLFTGWASVGEYRYHRAAPAYANLRANALLALDGSLGHTTEVLSGDYYSSLSTSSPHQIWSAAMVVNSMLRGMLGLAVNTQEKRVTIAPHVPADWDHFSVENIHVGADTLLFNYKKFENDGIVLETGLTAGTDECTVEFRPSISPRAKVQKVDLNGKSIPFRIETNGDDQHVVVAFPVDKGKYFLRIYASQDFSYNTELQLPALGSASRGLRIFSETWSPAKDALTLDVAGAAGQLYGIRVWSLGQIASVEGAGLCPACIDGAIEVEIPSSSSILYPHKTIVIHFVSGHKSK